MNVNKNKNVHEKTYDKLERFWGVRIKNKGWDKNNKTSSDMNYIGWYNSTYWFMNLYWIEVGLIILSMDKQYPRDIFLRYYQTH